MQVSGLLYDDPYPGKLQVLLLNLTIIILGLLMGIFNVGVGTVFRYLGGCCGFLLVFLMPVTVHLKVRADRRLLNPARRRALMPCAGDEQDLRDRGNLSRHALAFHGVLLAGAILVLIGQFLPPLPLEKHKPYEQRP